MDYNKSKTSVQREKILNVQDILSCFDKMDKKVKREMKEAESRQINSLKSASEFVANM